VVPAERVDLVVLAEGADLVAVEVVPADQLMPEVSGSRVRVVEVAPVPAVPVAD
jgi:hypothetical protein